MAKNRKNQAAALRFGPVVKAFLLCLLMGGSAVGYVWQKSQIDELGRQIKQREQRHLDLQNQNKKLSDQLAMLQSPANLEQRLRELNLGLALPQPNQVWRLAEPGNGIGSGGLLAAPPAARLAVGR